MQRSIRRDESPSLNVQRNFWDRSRIISAEALRYLILSLQDACAC